MATILKPEKLKFGNNPSALTRFDMHTITPRLSQVTDSKQLIFDMRKLNPGKYSFPYHFHRNS